jgi:hypothetical protein
MLFTWNAHPRLVAHPSFSLVDELISFSNIFDQPWEDPGVAKGLAAHPWAPFALPLPPLLRYGWFIDRVSVRYRVGTEGIAHGRSDFQHADAFAKRYGTPAIRQLNYLHFSC